MLPVAKYNLRDNKGMTRSAVVRMSPGPDPGPS